MSLILEVKAGCVRVTVRDARRIFGTFREGETRTVIFTQLFASHYHTAEACSAFQGIC